MFEIKKKIAFFFENLYNSPNTADKIQILKKGAFLWINLKMKNDVKRMR